MRVVELGAGLMVKKGFLSLGDFAALDWNLIGLKWAFAAWDLD